MVKEEGSEATALLIIDMFNDLSFSGAAGGNGFPQHFPLTGV